MFLFRIGKEKWAYTLTISIHKLKYSDLSSLNHSNIIEIRVARGNHELKYLSVINKRGQLVCDKRVQSIPMTLYYDTDGKTFNRKEMTIKGRVLDELNQVEVNLGEAELDIAENAREEGCEKFMLEVELQGKHKKVCKVKFSMAIQRNYDEKKTNFETTSQAASEKDSKGSKQSVEKAKHKSKQTSVRNNGKKQERSEEQSQANILSSFRPPQKVVKDTLSLQKKLKKSRRQEESKNEHQDEVTQRSISSKRRQYNAQSQDNDTVVIGRRSPPKVKTPPKLKTQPSSAYSIELKLYEAQQALKIKKRQLLKTKKLLQDQQQINLLLVQEQRKEQKNKETTKISREVQKLKTQLEVANMKISEVQSSNRSYLDQLQRSQRTAEKMGRHVEYYKGLVEREKMRIAEMLQKAFELGDNELISFVEEALQE